MASIGTRLFTWLKGEFIGEDEFGNRYYQERGQSNPWRRRRWVVYEGEVEASRVPPAWHGWLHYTVDRPPAGRIPTWPWQKPHLPNLTGTRAAYRPPGHDLQGGKRAAATGDYEPWKPS
jgi:NADH:ubiquinone oxidoreductase subunit